MLDGSRIAAHCAQALPVQDEMDEHEPGDGAGRQNALQPRIAKQRAANRESEEAHQEHKDGQWIVVVSHDLAGDVSRHGHSVARSHGIRLRPAGQCTNGQWPAARWNDVGRAPARYSRKRSVTYRIRRAS